MLLLLPALTFCCDLPTWPKRYFLRGYWVIPSSQIHEPVLVTSDRQNGVRQVESVYGGAERTIHINGTDRYVCQAYRQDSQIQSYCGHYSGFPAGSPDFITEYLPTNCSAWTYLGIKPVLGVPCDYWQSPGINASATGWYFQFFAAVDDHRPIRFFTHGAGNPESHPTDYFFDITDWGPTINEIEFLLPSNCTDLPFNASRKLHRRRHAQPPYPVQTLCQNVSESEIPAVSVPDNFSWRSVPGVLPRVRHQSICGSCWAVASSEVLSAQVSLRVGSRTELSSQQIVDCTWGSGNAACDGGEANDAYSLLANRSIPLALEDDYPYIGASGLCPDNWRNPLNFVVDPVVPCKRFLTSMTDTSHVFLRKALFVYGPLVVAIRADVPLFSELTANNAFYRDTEYCDTAKWDKDMTDHDVMLTGWQTVDGQIWLEIQNSWSTDWGSDGYAWINGVYHCGIPELVVIPQIKVL